MLLGAGLLLAALIEPILLERLRERQHELRARWLARAKEATDDVLYSPTAAGWIDTDAGKRMRSKFLVRKD